MSPEFELKLKQKISEQNYRIRELNNVITKLLIKVEKAQAMAREEIEIPEYNDNDIMRQVMIQCVSIDIKQYKKWSKAIDMLMNINVE